ncbi:MAG TPA: hypothetical protein VFN46_08450 [Acetobacteraceae bacterium]|nr:hypothetical protein [Acetobacteraceae bacterium]
MRRVIAAGIVACAAWQSLPPAAAQTPWALVARRALGKVEQLRQEPQGAQPGYDVASVLLDVPAEHVFARITETVHANRTVRVMAADAAKRHLELAQGKRTVSLTVLALGDNVSQLLIAGNVVAGEESATSHVVETVLRVCRDLHRQCSASP